MKLRGEVWAVDFEPQTHRQEPGKKERPALIIQCGALNEAPHPKKAEEALRVLIGRYRSPNCC